MPLQLLEENFNKYSKKKIRCKCDCGNPEELLVTANTLDRSPGCGECAFWKWYLATDFKYGNWTIFEPEKLPHKYNIRVDVVCTCGILRNVRLMYLVEGKIGECKCTRPKRQTVKHKHVKKEVWLSQMPSMIDDGTLPDEWTPRGQRKFKFRCKCGSTYSRMLLGYIEGRSTCGKCFTKTFETGMKIGRYTFLGPTQRIDIRTRKKHEFECHCGKKFLVGFYYIHSCIQKSCGKCTESDSHPMPEGFKLLSEGPFTKYSTRKAKFQCRCGQEFEAIFSNVAYGTTKSCGNCRKTIEYWREKNADFIQNAKCPIIKDRWPEGGPIFVSEVIKNTKEKLEMLCGICEQKYYPALEWIRSGTSLSCGCASNRVSSGVREIVDFLKQSGVDSVETEFSIGKLKYDIGCPTYKFLIEYQGLKWHSQERSRQAAFIKYETALKSGYQVVALFEDEWLNKSDTMKRLLMNRITSVHPFIQKRLRVQNLVFSWEASGSVDPFYDQNHYLGSCRAPMNLVAKHNDEIVGAISFKTRRASRLMIGNWFAW